LNKSQLCLLIVHIALVQSIGENYPMSQTAYFATGCFWGAERRFWNLDGVIQTSVGYMGGEKPDPTYKEVCTGKTNHAEIVEVIFDPQLISYKRLLAEFWVMHDPTSLNQQGGDIGTQYRSAIFTTSSEQMQQVLESKEIYQGELSKNEIGKIVTQILPAAGVTYWLAEEYHQRYLEKNPNGYDCHSSTGVTFPSALMSNNG
jgi:peptide-methionine (S)-S-oxide reductase